MTYNHPEYHTAKAEAYLKSVNRVEDALSNFHSKLEDFSSETGIDMDY